MEGADAMEMEFDQSKAATNEERAEPIPIPIKSNRDGRETA
jgi:hypothetical protein